MTSVCSSCSWVWCLFSTKPLSDKSLKESSVFIGCDLVRNGLFNSFCETNFGCLILASKFAYMLQHIHVHIKIKISNFCSRNKTEGRYFCFLSIYQILEQSSKNKMSFRISQFRKVYCCYVSCIFLPMSFLPPLWKHQLNLMIGSCKFYQPCTLSLVLYFEKNSNFPGGETFFYYINFF